MRIPLIAGAVLVLAGLFLLVRGFTYTKEESVFKVGDLEAKVQQERSVPQWIGGLVLGAGVVLVFVGLRRR